MLVTGAGGFIGKALCHHLQGRGYSVRGVLREFPKTDHLGSLSTDYVSIGSLDERTDFTPLLQGVDVVIHLAARVHVMSEAATDPMLEYRRVNVELTMALAKQAAANGVKRFVFLSSIKANGEKTQLGRPFSADDIPTPEDPYGLSKLEAERLLFALSRETAMQVVVIRPPLVYGPGVKANFEALMRLLRNPVPLPFAGLSNRRSLVSIDNLTDFIGVCAVHPAAAGEVFLVSDGCDLSMVELLRMMARNLGGRPIQFSLPDWLLRRCAAIVGREAYARRLMESLQVDIEKNVRLLGWSPNRNVEGFIEATALAFLKLENRR